MGLDRATSGEVSKAQLYIKMPLKDSFYWVKILGRSVQESDPDLHELAESHARAKSKVLELIHLMASSNSHFLKDIIDESEENENPLRFSDHQENADGNMSKYSILPTIVEYLDQPSRVQVFIRMPISEPRHAYYWVKILSLAGSGGGGEDSSDEPPVSCENERDQLVSSHERTMKQMLNLLEYMKLSNNDFNRDVTDFLMSNNL